jgi:hypothetical protein
MSSRVLRPGRVRCGCGEHEPEVSVLVRGLLSPGWNRHDGDMPQFAVRPRGKIGQAGFLPALADGDGQRIGLAGIGVPSYLQPGLLAFVPAEEYPPARRVNDERRRRGVQRNGPCPRVCGTFRESENALPIGRLLVALRLVSAQQADETITIGILSRGAHSGEPRPSLPGAVA